MKENTRTAKKSTQKKDLLLYIILVIILIVTMIVCISVGSVSISLDQTISVFVHRIFGVNILNGFDDKSEAIIMTLRAPRVILAIFVGSALSASGAAMQGLIKNPLADGTVLGITAGGSLGAVVALAFGITLPWFPGLTVTISAIIFSMISLFIIINFAKKMDSNLSSNTIVLTGIIFSMLINSIVTLIISFSGDNAKNILFWSLGSLSGASWGAVAIAAVFILIGLIGILFYSRELDAFSMGEEQAQYIGVDVKRVRTRLLIFTSILCGASVSIAGNIAFVGLVIPHALRLLVGPLHVKLIPMSIFGGAIFMMICDLLARTVISPIEMPVGVVTSIIGSVTFAYIFYKSSNR